MYSPIILMHFVYSAVVHFSKKIHESIVNSFAFCFLVCVAFEIELERLSIPNSSLQTSQIKENPQTTCFPHMIPQNFPVF